MSILNQTSATTANNDQENNHSTSNHHSEMFQCSECKEEWPTDENHYCTCGYVYCAGCKSHWDGLSQCFCLNGDN